jgi:hypothetical protein
MKIFQILEFKKAMLTSNQEMISRQIQKKVYSKNLTKLLSLSQQLQSIPSYQMDNPIQIIDLHNGVIFITHTSAQIQKQTKDASS